jgi:hypothetical protein
MFVLSADEWLWREMGIGGIPIPYGAPNAAAHIERLIGTLRRECLDRMLIWNKRHLRCVLTEFICWYNRGRVHQGLNVENGDVRTVSLVSSTRYMMRKTRNDCTTKSRRKNLLRKPGKQFGRPRLFAAFRRTNGLKRSLQRNCNGLRCCMRKRRRPVVFSKTSVMRPGRAGLENVGW